MVNFGIPYGFCLGSQRLGTIGRQEAQVIIDHYLLNFLVFPPTWKASPRKREKKAMWKPYRVEDASKDIDSRNATIALLRSEMPSICPFTAPTLI